MVLILFALLQNKFLIFFVQLSEVKVFLTMLSPEIDNISIPPHEFNLKNTIRNEEDEIFGPYFEEERQTLDFRYNFCIFSSKKVHVYRHSASIKKSRWY